jgi:hypothetical protein
MENTDMIAFRDMEIRTWLQISSMENTDMVAYCLWKHGNQDIISSVLHPVRGKKDLAYCVPEQTHKGRQKHGIRLCLFVPDHKKRRCKSSPRTQQF